jgi:hypothetical protein
VPKRQPKPEPITPEEVMGSPALQGFDTFLRYRSTEQPESGNGGAEEAESRSLGGGQASSPTAATPTSITPTGITPMGIPPQGDAPVGDFGLSLPPIENISVSLPAGIAEVKPGPKIRRAIKAQDGHSMGEQAVYQALWNAASPEGHDTRLIRIGYGGLQSLCGLDKTNCKDNLRSLIQKLAIEVVSPFSVKKNEGNAYRIFSPAAVLKRRKAAGMEWVIRNKGVRFVDYSPIGE